MATAENVLSGLKAALKITNEKPVVLEARSGKLFIGSHNDFHSVVYECDTDWEDSKYVFTYDVAKELPKSISGTISLTPVDGNMVKLVSKGVKLKLTLLEPTALSLSKLVTKFTKGEFWTVDGSSFHKSLELVKHSANDKTIGDEVLKGYHLTKVGDGLEIMASNGASMSVASTPLLTPSTHEGCILLNREFGNLTPLFSGKTTFAFTDETVSVTTELEGGVLRSVSTLTQGKAFNYKDIVSFAESNDILVTFPTKTLLEALRRSDFFTDKKQNSRVTLLLDESQATIVSVNQYGESSQHVEVLESNLEDPLSVDLNGTSLLNYISSSKTDSVTLKLKDESSPAFLSNGLSKEVTVLFTK